MLQDCEWDYRKPGKDGEALQGVIITLSLKRQLWEKAT